MTFETPLTALSTRRISVPNISDFATRLKPHTTWPTLKTQNLSMQLLANTLHLVRIESRPTPSILTVPSTRSNAMPVWTWTYLMTSHLNRRSRVAQSTLLTSFYPQCNWTSSRPWNSMMSQLEPVLEVVLKTTKCNSEIMRKHSLDYMKIKNWI